MMLPERPAKAPEASALAGQPTAATCDAFLDGKLKIYQPKSGPRAGIDAVFLAAAVPATGKDGEHVLEAGSGCGVVALALAGRIEGMQVTGLELQAELCQLAKRNVSANELSDRVHIVQEDMQAPRERLEALGLVLESFDHVVANPPFNTEGQSRKCSEPAKTRAHMARAGALDRWVRFLTAMAVPHGCLTMIHRADALASLLELLDGRFGALTVFPLFPHANEPASRIIVQGIKGSRAPLKLSAGLVLHDTGGGYTPEAERVLRDGQALVLAA